MKVKLLEIRDRATFIPAIAIQLGSRSEEERWLLSRSGYGRDNESHKTYVLLTPLIGGKICYDPYDWGVNPRTYHVAHMYVVENWEKIASGDVICVETILGERDSPKTSERMEM